MHDRHQSGQEPTVVVDNPSDAGLPFEALVEDTSSDDLGAYGCESTETDPDEFDEKSPVDEPENAFARRAKLIALLVATAALVVSVVVASIITSSADEAAPPIQEHRITGVAALGGFALPSSTDQRETGSDAAPTADLVEDPPSSDPTTRHTDPAGESVSAVPVSTDSGPRSAPGTRGPDVAALESETTAAHRTDHTEMVRDFYSRVAAAPETALELVTSDLVADQREYLLSAWRSMTDIVVEHVRQVSEDSVHVVVTVKTAHGNPVRITQLLSFSDGPRPFINHAALLSIRAL